MKHLSVTIHHGQYLKTETHSAPTIREAMEKLATTKMGIGYAPNVGSPQFEHVLKTLEQSGGCGWGWGRYVVQ